MLPARRAATAVLCVLTAVVGASCGTDRPADGAAATPPATVDFASHRAAVDAYLACAREQDIDVGGPWRVPDGSLFYVAASGPMGGAVDQQLNACYTDDIAAVDREFQLSVLSEFQAETLPAEIQAEVRADVPFDCLGLAGDEPIAELAREWEDNQVRYIDCLTGLDGEQQTGS